MAEKPSAGATRATPLPQPPNKPAVVRVSIPARVAYDLKSMTKITANVLRELGCDRCHSGFDIRFDVISQYTIDKNLDVIPFADVAG